MKLRQQEKLRLFLFVAAYGTSFLTKANGADINEIFSNYSVTIEDISKLSFILEDIMILGSSHMEFITEEHKNVRTSYNEIIKSASDLFKLLGVDNNPVKSFALYVYLYRKGYFSCNHQFCYSQSGKDFSRLSGADVVAGHGVCRAISSMFTDICNQIGMEASVTPIRVIPKKFNNLVQLNPVELNYDGRNNLASKIIPYLPVGNHVTSHISYNGLKYDFDPTNDILLTEKNGKLYVSDSSDSYVKHDKVISFIPFLLGQINFDIKGILGIKDINMPTITHEEYVQLYREVLEIIKDNRDLFEQFYNDNKDKYYEVASTMNEQHSLIKRYMPILPIK